MSKFIHRNQEEKDPWQKDKRADNEADELEESIKQFQARLRKMFGGGSKGGTGGSQPEHSDGFGFLLIAILGLIAAIWFLSGIFTVQPSEKAVITRFGKYQQTVGSGLHWIPQFVERHYIVNEQHISSYSYQHDMLTKDENLVNVSVVVQYRIANARNFLFNVVSPTTSLQQATASALRQVIGDMKLGAILATGREQLRQRLAEHLKGILKLYKTGLEITEVAMQPATPPTQVRDAFDDVINAMEDETRYSNEADADALKYEQQASGQAQRVINEAQAYKAQVVLKARAHTASFLALLKPYELAPKVTRERLYIDAVQSALQKSTKLLIDVGDKGNSMIYLPLDKILAREQAGHSVSDTASLDKMNSIVAKAAKPTVTHREPVEQGAPTSRPQRPWTIPVGNQVNARGAY